MSSQVQGGRAENRKGAVTSFRFRLAIPSLTLLSGIRFSELESLVSCVYCFGNLLSSCTDLD